MTKTAQPIAQLESSPQSDDALEQSHSRIRSVCFVAPFGLGRKTTVWARTLPMAQVLRRRGVAAAIVVPPWDSPAQAGLQWQDEGVTLDNVKLRYGPPAILARLLRRVRRLQPDIVHIVKPTAYAGLVQWLLWTIPKLRNPSTKIVLDVDDWEQDWAVLNRRPALVQRFIAWQESWGMTHAHGVTAASRWLVEQVTQRKPQMPVCYLPNGVRPNESFPGGQNGADVLFFTRFIEATPQWLASFCRALFDAHPTTTLHIAGSGVSPEIETGFKADFSTPDMQAYIEAGRIRWAGHVRPSELDALYARCACAIFPAQPTPLQEAKCSVRLATTLLSGVPIVASSVGEQTAYGEAGGACLLPAGTGPAEFARTVAAVLDAPETYRSRQAGSRAALLATYDWQVLGRRLLAFYHEI